MKKMTMRDQVELLELMKQFDLEKECKEECCEKCHYAVKYSEELFDCCPLNMCITMIYDKIYRTRVYKKNMLRGNKK